MSKCVFIILVRESIHTCTDSTASALSITSSERGIQPRGNSACVSWILIFWKSTKTDLSASSMNRLRFAQTGFRHIAGNVY